MSSEKQTLEVMRHFSNSIKLVFLREGVSATEVRIKQGPMTITFQISLSEVSRKAIAAVRNLGETIAQEAGRGPVRVSFQPGSVLIEFPSEEAFTPPARVLNSHARGANVVIGMDHWDDPVFLNLAQHPNVLFVGPPLHGKTTAMRSILYQAINGGVEFIIIAERMVSWQVFTRLQGCIGVFGSADLGKQVLQQLTTQMQAHANNASKFNPRVILILDDLISLLQARPDLSEDIKRLASAGGQVGIYILMGTQSAGSRESAGGMLVEDLMTARVIYRMPGSGAAYRASGVGETDISGLSGLPGDALFMTGATGQRVATGHVSDAELIKELPPFKDRVPSSTAFVFTPPTRVEKTARPTVTPAQQTDRGVMEELYDPNEVVPGLPVVKPARLLTEDEVVRACNYLDHCPMRQNEFLVAVFGNKGSGPRTKMIASFGDTRWNQYFPKKSVSELSEM